VLRYARIVSQANLVALDLRLVIMLARQELIQVLGLQFAVDAKRGRILPLELSFVRNVKNVESANISQRLAVLALILFAKNVPPERLRLVVQLTVLNVLVRVSIRRAKEIRFALSLQLEPNQILKQRVL